MGIVLDCPKVAGVRLVQYASVKSKSIHVIHVPLMTGQLPLSRARSSPKAYLKVLPVVRTHRSGALSEVDLLVGVGVVERILVVDTAAVAMEGNTSEGVRSLLHL